MDYRYVHMRFPFHPRQPGVNHHHAGKMGVVTFAFDTNEAPVGISYCSPENSFSRREARKRAVENVLSEQSSVTRSILVAEVPDHAYAYFEQMLRSGVLRIPQWLKLWFRLEKYGVVIFPKKKNELALDPEDIKGLLGVEPMKDVLDTLRAIVNGDRVPYSVIGKTLQRLALFVAEERTDDYNYGLTPKNLAGLDRVLVKLGNFHRKHKR